MSGSTGRRKEASARAIAAADNGIPNWRRIVGIDSMRRSIQIYSPDYCTPIMNRIIRLGASGQREALHKRHRETG